MADIAVSAWLRPGRIVHTGLYRYKAAFKPVGRRHNGFALILPSAGELRLRDAPVLQAAIESRQVP